MPYITKTDRKKFDDLLKQLQKFNNIGEVNYLITMICDKYVKDRGERYQHYNDTIGVLECAKLELYRRKVSKYEDVKIEENGDIY